MWLIVALIKSIFILHYIIPNISPIRKKYIGIVGDIKTEPWSKINVFAVYKNQVIRLTLKLLIYSLFLYVQTCWIVSHFSIKLVSHSALRSGKYVRKAETAFNIR